MSRPVKSAVIPNLGDLLAREGLTQRQAAERLGIHHSIVGLWARGKRGVGAPYLPSLATILGMTVQELTKGCVGAPRAAKVRPAPATAPLPADYRSPRCAACDKPMPGAITAVTCRSCTTNRWWREGRFDHASDNRVNGWSDAEQDRLKELAGRMPAEEIAAVLGREFPNPRTVHAIRKKAGRLGVYLALDVWSLSRLESLFNAKREAIHRRWFQTELLKTRRGTKGAWIVDEPDLVTFIRNHPWAYRADGMRPATHPLAVLAHGVVQRDPYLTSAEASAYLNISQRAFRRWVKAGVIPAKQRWASTHWGATGVYVVRASDLLEAKRVIHERRASARTGNMAKLHERRRNRREVAA